MRLRQFGPHLYLQIQQGVLESDLRVNSSTVSWKDIEYARTGEIAVPRRPIALTSTVKEDSVVTGVEFSIRDDTICLEVRTSLVNVDTGKLEESNTLHTAAVSSCYDVKALCRPNTFSGTVAANIRR